MRANWCIVPDDFFIYIIVAVVLLVILAVLRYVAIRNRPSRPTLKSFEDKAKTAGADGRKAPEQEIKTTFEDFRRKENSL
jgi:hypothetical protein